MRCIPQWFLNPAKALKLDTNCKPDLTLYIATANELTDDQVNKLTDQLDLTPAVKSYCAALTIYQDILSPDDFYVTTLQIDACGNPYVLLNTHALPLLSYTSWTTGSRIDYKYIETVLAPVFLPQQVALTPPPPTPQPLYRTISISPIDISQQAINGVLQKAKCECGAHSTFGNNCHSSNHSRWCPLYKE